MTSITILYSRRRRRPGQIRRYGVPRLVRDKVQLICFFKRTYEYRDKHNEHMNNSREKKFAKQAVQ